MNNQNHCVPLDQNQKKFCSMETGFIRLLAPAGAGKTHSILWRCRELIKRDPTRQILIFTFTRAARDELMSRLNRPEFAPLQANLTITTLNSYGFRLVKQTMSHTALLNDKFKRLACMKRELIQICAKYPAIAAIMNDNRKRIRTSEVLFELSDRMKSLGFRHDRCKDFNQFLFHLEHLANIGMGLMVQSLFNDLHEIHVIRGLKPELLRLWSRYDKLSDIQKKSLRMLANQMFELYIPFWIESTEALIQSGQITLEDQKYIARIILKTQLEQNVYTDSAIAVQYIFVDEFQDINPLDLALLKAIMGVNRAQMTIVGDDDQAIYEWRGAAPEFILNPEAYIKHEFQTSILSVNYRSPSNIVRLSQNLIKHNTRRVDKDIRAHIEKDARIEILKSPDIANSIKNVCAKVIQCIENDQRVALISRKKSQLIPYQICFAGKDIEFCAAEDLQIFLSETFAELKEMMRMCGLASSKSTDDFDPVSSLLKLCDYVRKYELTKKDRTELLTHLLNKKPKTLWEASAAMRSYRGPLNGDNSDARKSEKYVTAIQRLLKAKTVSEALNTISHEFDGLKKKYGRGIEDIFYTDPPFIYLAEYAKRYGTNFLAFYNDLEKAIATLASHYDDDGKPDDCWGRQLHLMTALRAKGKEFDAVFVLDANQGVWPSKLAETESELEQERRLFYVAMTRARQYLCFVVNESMLGRCSAPTQYIREMDLQS